MRPPGESGVEIRLPIVAYPSGPRAFGRSMSRRRTAPMNLFPPLGTLPREGHFTFFVRDDEHDCPLPSKVVELDQDVDQVSQPHCRPEAAE